MEYIIEQEKFSAVKELSNIQLAVVEARNNLALLKEKTEQFMEEREYIAVDRVNKVLGESREVLEEINKNHGDIVAFRNEVKAYATNINNFASTIATLSDVFIEQTATVDAAFEAHRARMQEILNENKKIAVGIAEDRKMLAHERSLTANAMIKLRDREAMLERTWKELQELKKNK